MAIKLAVDSSVAYMEATKLDILSLAHMRGETR